MASERLLERFLDPLLHGRRQECRDVLATALSDAPTAETLYRKLMWPALEEVGRMYREGRISLATEHMATRIGRVLADQLQTELVRKEPNGKRILISCADHEPEELGAQMCADLFEADGWDVFFIGGGVPNDEILSLVGKLRPEVLLIFGTQAEDLPVVRQLIDLIRDIGANPTMNIMISGGIFSRAEGLWKEVQADLFATTAAEALQIAGAAEPRHPVVRLPDVPKKRRRRRRPEVATA
jgi:methanogenic corrinoid protein MtbC1